MAVVQLSDDVWTTYTGFVYNLSLDVFVHLCGMSTARLCKAGGEANANAIHNNL